MTDKPDVAALVEWLQTCSPVTENGKRAHLAASELTRLAAERDTCIAGNVDMVRNAEAWEAKCNTAWAERDAAKAEIAQLREATLEEAAKFIEANTIMDGSTGQSIVPRKYDGDRFGLAYADGIRALKPNTGEK